MKVLVAVDDSKFSESALQAVVAQSRPQETEVRVLHVVAPISISVPPEMSAGYAPEIEGRLRESRELVERAAQSLHAGGFKVDTDVEKGDAREKIVDSAEAWDADLIIIGSHGRRGVQRFLLGSVAEHVARHAHCSVEIVRVPVTHGRMSEEKRMKVLLAIDDSKFAEAAAQAIIQQIRPEHAEVYVLHVVDIDIILPYSYAAKVRQETLKRAKELVQQTGQLLERAGYKVKTAIEEGDPKSKIIDYVANRNADLVLVGSHGRKGLDRFLLGSVSEAVARHACCSVEIVRIRAGR